jgi:hypothetical protein
MRTRFLPSVFCILCLATAGWAADNNGQSNSNTSDSNNFVFPMNNAGQKPPATPDIWLGGRGNWSDPTKWSSGVPGSSSNVIINLGHSNVTLDTSGNIQALSLGASGGTSRAGLQGNRTAQTLGIAGDVTVTPTGVLQMESDTFNVGGDVIVTGNSNALGYVGVDWGSTLRVAGNMQNFGQMQITPFGTGGDNLTVTGSFSSGAHSETLIENASDQVSFGTMSIGGELFLQTGAVLTLTNQPNGITTILPRSVWEINGPINAAGNPPFANLQTVEGSLQLNNGEATVITPPNGTLNINGGGLGSTSTMQINGNAYLEYGSINGNDVTVSGSLIIGAGGVAAGTISVARGITTGNLGSIQIIGSQTISTPTLTNLGFTYLQQNSVMVVGSQSGRKPSLGPGYHQEANGVLTTQIAKRAYGIVQAPSVFLDGTLNIQLLPGALPPVGSRYKIVYFESGGLTGQFATVNNTVFNNGTERWVVNYNQNGGYVELQAIANAGMH